MSLVDRRFVPALSAGLLASGIAALLSFGAAPEFTSLAITLFGAQLGIAGITWRGPVEGAPGWVIAAAGITSLWWTTGTNAWAIDAVAPYGATGADLAVAVAVAVLLAARLRRPADQHDLAADLVVARLRARAGDGGHVAAVVAARSRSDWATMAALVVGVASILVGATRRLGAPLVIGTATRGRHDRALGRAPAGYGTDMDVDRRGRCGVARRGRARRAFRPTRAAGGASCRRSAFDRRGVL